MDSRAELVAREVARRWGRMAHRIPESEYAREADRIDLHECEGAEAFRTANEVGACLLRVEREARDLEHASVSDLLYSVAAHVEPQRDKALRYQRNGRSAKRDEKAAQEMAVRRAMERADAIIAEELRARGHE